VLLLCVLVANVVLVGPAAPAAAECPPPSTQENALTRANAVFVAEVISVENRGRTAEAQVLAVWKGRDLPERITLLGGSSDPTVVDSDDRTYRVGVTYLVVSQGVRPPFNDNRCTATRPYNALPNQIPPNLRDAVGSDTARAPIPSDAEEAEADQAENRLSLAIIVFGIAVMFIVGVIALTTGGGSRRRRIAEMQTAQKRQTARPEARREPDEDAKPPRKRRLAGWINGMMGRSGVEQVAKYRVVDRKRREKVGAEGPLANGAEPVVEQPTEPAEPSD
jgi:hypothetical protein